MGRKHTLVGPIVQILFTEKVEGDNRQYFETDMEGFAERHPEATEIILTAGLADVNLSKIVTPSLKKLRLSCPNVTGIDLSPLSICGNLTTLFIGGGLEMNRVDLSGMNYDSLTTIRIVRCKATDIDLSPLGDATVLREIIIVDSPLRSIDFTPLRNCHLLSEIDLTDNQLQSVDLAPLSSLKNLSSLRLSGNKFRHIDLGPLSGGPIKEIELKSRVLREIDISPLLSCNELILFDHSANRLRASSESRGENIPLGLRGVLTISDSHEFRWY